MCCLIVRVRAALSLIASERRLIFHLVAALQEKIITQQPSHKPSLLRRISAGNSSEAASRSLTCNQSRRQRHENEIFIFFASCYETGKCALILFDYFSSPSNSSRACCDDDGISSSCCLIRGKWPLFKWLQAFQLRFLSSDLLKSSYFCQCSSSRFACFSDKRSGKRTSAEGKLITGVCVMHQR